jgi:uncharacterized protein (DUF305 family)
MDRNFWIGLVAGIGITLFTAFSGMFGMMSGVGDQPGTHMMTDMPQTGIFAEAMDKMHQDMGAKETGNPDVDFMRGMIPHHQGAIDMARIVLEKGSDAEVKSLAQSVIAAQEAEIAQMQDWLTRNSP